MENPESKGVSPTRSISGTAPYRYGVASGLLSQRLNEEFSLRVPNWEGRLCPDVELPHPPTRHPIGRASIMSNRKNQSAAQVPNHLPDNRQNANNRYHQSIPSRGIQAGPC